MIGAADGLIRRWNITTAEECEPIGTANANFLALSQDGKTLASASDNSIAMWQLDSDRRRPVTILAIPTAETIGSLSLSSDGTIAVTASNNDYLPGAVRIWELNNGSQRHFHFDQPPTKVNGSDMVAVTAEAKAIVNELTYEQTVKFHASVEWAKVVEQEKHKRRARDLDEETRKRSADKVKQHLANRRQQAKSAASKPSKNGRV